MVKDLFALTPDDFSSETSDVIRGYVKWFDPARGFGFVVCEGIAHDVLLHANVLRNYGQSSVADGAEVRLRVLSTSKGTQATELVAIDMPDAGPARIEGGEILDDAALAALDLEPARIKWFDRGKGFGFANVFGRPEDVFVHMEILRASGLAEIAPGEAVCLRIVDGKRGRMAVQLMSWESAARRTE